MILEKLPLSQVQTPIQTTSQIPHLQIYILSRFDRLSLINRGCIPFILFEHTDLWLSSERGLFSCAKWWHEIHWEYWFYGNWDVLMRKKKYWVHNTAWWYSQQSALHLHLHRLKLKPSTWKFCFFSVYTCHNHRDIRGIIGIEDVSANKGDRNGEQEEIQQINIHTKLDILKRYKLIRIWIAL